MSLFWPDGELIAVRKDSSGAPGAFTWYGRSHEVRGVAKRWRVDHGWWCKRVWREYYKLHTDTGLLVILYMDLLTGQWFLQRLYD